MVEFGICMPKETIDRIKLLAKGPYMSRGRYIWKAVDKLLAEEEEKQQVTIAVSDCSFKIMSKKSLPLGVEGSSHFAQQQLQCLQLRIQPQLKATRVVGTAREEPNSQESC